MREDDWKGHVLVWWKCSVSWIGCWLHSCMSLSKFIKLYIWDLCIFLMKILPQQRNREQDEINRVSMCNPFKNFSVKESWEVVQHLEEHLFGSYHPSRVLKFSSYRFNIFAVKFTFFLLLLEMVYLLILPILNGYCCQIGKLVIFTYYFDNLNLNESFYFF